MPRMNTSLRGAISEDRIEKMEELAANPPKWVVFPAIWEKVVLESAHIRYGSAVAHYRAYQRKHGILIEQPKSAS